MLVLAREKGESIVVGDDVEVTVRRINQAQVELEIVLTLNEKEDFTLKGYTFCAIDINNRGQVKLGIDAPKDVSILRKELTKN